jgi:hypothetical protein
MAPALDSNSDTPIERLPAPGDGLLTVTVGGRLLRRGSR